MDVPLRTERPPRIPRELAPSRRVQLRDDAPVVNHMDPPSFPAEQYRGLAVQVEERINPLGTRGYTLTVTSPEEAAGKTLTSLNLALTLTRGEERRVLLLEGDLWRPQLHTYFLPERPDRLWAADIDSADHGRCRQHLHRRDQVDLRYGAGLPRGRNSLVRAGRLEGDLEAHAQYRAALGNPATQEGSLQSAVRL